MNGLYLVLYTSHIFTLSPTFFSPRGVPHSSPA